MDRKIKMICFIQSLPLWFDPSWSAQLIPPRKADEQNKFSEGSVFCTPWKHYKPVLRIWFIVSSQFHLSSYQPFNTTATSCKASHNVMVQEEKLLAQFSEWLQRYTNSSSFALEKAKLKFWAPNLYYNPTTTFLAHTPVNICSHLWKFSLNYSHWGWSAQTCLQRKTISLLLSQPQLLKVAQGPGCNTTNCTVTFLPP